MSDELDNIKKDVDNVKRDVDEIKSRLGGTAEDAKELNEEVIEILDETVPEEEPFTPPTPNEIAEGLGRLGRKFADRLNDLNEPEAREKLGNDLKAGMKQFTEEIEKAVGDTPIGQKIKDKAESNAPRANEAAQRARTGMVSGLRWLSGEMDKLATQFAPDEKDDIEIITMDVEDEGKDKTG